MKKGQTTREHIIASSAALFNSRGYAGTPLSQLMESTGLKKGGIYNHFESKEDILVAAFDYSMELLIGKVEAAISAEATPLLKMRALLEFYRDYPMNPVIKGGCPLLNAMIDADNTNPRLAHHVQDAIRELTRRLSAIIRAGKKAGEFLDSVDSDKAAVVILAAIEGAVALSRNFERNGHMETVIDYLHGYVDLMLRT